MMSKTLYGLEKTMHTHDLQISSEKDTRVRLPGPSQDFTCAKEATRVKPK
jgi:hypothetical protein